MTHFHGYHCVNHLSCRAGYSTQRKESGVLEFYNVASASVIFNKIVFSAAAASAVSGQHNGAEDNVCTQGDNSATFDRATASLTINLQMCRKLPCKTNLCPGILSPEAFGYNYNVDAWDRYMHVKVNMQDYVMAAAVNMGIRSLDSMIELVDDARRTGLLKKMLSAGNITEAIYNRTSSYLDHRYPSSNPIYWFV
jgi:hypothetical protein